MADKAGDRHAASAAPLMHVGVVSLFPQMLDALSACGVVGRALSQGLVRLRCWNPRDFTQDRWRRVDDAPYGGGPGMVMMAESLAAALAAARAELPGPAKTVCMSAQGRLLDQAWLAENSGRNLLFLAGRYAGIDERLIETEVDEEVSVGDFVLSGGELPAMLALDGLIRLLPGALGNPESCQADSFAEPLDGMLAGPEYTRPRVFADRAVPDVLLSGDHQAIAAWRRQQARSRTAARRPELLRPGAEPRALSPSHHGALGH